MTPLRFVIVCLAVFGAGVFAGDSEELTLIKQIASDVQTVQTTLSWYINLINSDRFTVSTLNRGKVYFATKVASTFDINKANEDCKYFAGCLVELDNLDEFDFVYNFIWGLGRAGYYYTGTNDINIEGRYAQFNSGRLYQVDKWYVNEPNDLGITGLEEDCVGFNTAWLNGIADLQCSLFSYYVCEAEFPPRYY